MKLLRGILVMLLTCLSLVFVLPVQSTSATTTSYTLSSNDTANFTTTPNGEITIGCSSDHDLVTYDSTGDNIRTLDRGTTIDGVPNCIDKPVVDKDGTLYGRPYSFSTSTFGPNLLAYDGTTLRWKYPVSCAQAGKNVAVGSGGIIYVATDTTSGPRLLGLDPVLAPSTTVPTVVFDESISSCNVELQSFNDGIAVGLPSAPSTTFFDDDGSILGSVGKVGRVNAEGRLFVDNGSFMGINVAAYDTDGSQAWSYTSSDYSLGTTGRPLPSPDGGVFLAGSQMGTTTTYLRKLDSSGNVVKSLTLSDPVVAGESFWGPGWSTSTMTVNDKGEFIIYLPGGKDGTTATKIMVVSPSMRVSSQKVTTALPTTILNNMQYDRIKLAGNRVILMTETYPDVKVAITDHADVGFDYPRSSVFSATSPKLDYVAMGDSFSSGEGNELYNPSTDLDTNDANENMCHRSSTAYPNWLDQTLGLPGLDLVDFVACSGATTDDVRGVAEGDDPIGKGHETAQVNALSDDTDIVTITIGGNDIGFREFASSCVVDVCDTTSDIYADTVLKISADLPDKLEDVFTAIVNKTENAHVYVIGYPQLIPDTGLDDLPTQCDYLDSSTPGDGLDAVAAAQVVDALNAQLDTSVAAFDNTINDTEFTFVDPNSSVDGTFEGHDLCSGATTTYFHNVTPNDLFGNGYRPNIFHPNVDGQHEYYKIVEGAIEN